MTEDPIVIVGAARTPMGGFQGDLAEVSASHLGGIAIAASIDRAGIEPGDVDEVIMGVVLAAGQGQAPARQAGFDVIGFSGDMIHMRTGMADSVNSALAQLRQA